jgi:simple sugar transport system permease protein
MSATPETTPERDPGTTISARLGEHLRAGGLWAPVVTVLAAFLAGGLVIAATGKSPATTYQAIFEGSGLNWLLPWTSGADREIAAINLQQTLILATPLLLAGLAVGFAFRAGLFNIGGTGQYIVGLIVAAWVGSSLDGLPGWLHIVVTMVLAAGAGAAWGAIAGGLRASTGANEVITTIMLNYIALWVGVFLFGLGGPLQNGRDASLPQSNPVADDAKLPVFWGDPVLQGLHVGIFVALAAAVVYWVLLNRSRQGYEARAVGFSPEAARYAGIGVGRTYVVVMGICGALAGLAGSLDVLGWQFQVATNDIQTTQIGFLGIAVALLGRNTAVGTVLAALLFAALLNGTSTRALDPTVFEPQLAGNLTTIIQGIVVLLVTLDVALVEAIRRARTRRGRRRGEPAAVAAP